MRFNFVSSFIGTYENDDVSEVDGDTGESRCDLPGSHGDLPRGFGPGESSPNRIEKEVRKNEDPNNVKISSCQSAVWCDEARRGQRRQQGSIDDVDTQYESRRW